MWGHAMPNEVTPTTIVLKGLIGKIFTTRFCECNEIDLLLSNHLFQVSAFSQVSKTSFIPKTPFIGDTVWMRFLVFLEVYQFFFLVELDFFLRGTGLRSLNMWSYPWPCISSFKLPQTTWPRVASSLSSSSSAWLETLFLFSYLFLREKTNLSISVFNWDNIIIN